MRRPIAVTVVSGLIILGAVLSLLGALFTAVHGVPISPRFAMLLALDPVPFRVQLAILFLVSLIDLIAAIVMLNGWGMGRALYTVVGGLGLIFAFATSPIKPQLIVDLVIFGVFLFFLYRPVSSRWFRQTGFSSFP